MENNGRKRGRDNFDRNWGRKQRIIRISTYNTESWKNMKKKIDDLQEEKEYCKIIIGGDINIRTEELRGSGIQGKENKRESRDKEIGKDGKTFIEWIQEKG